MVPDENLPAETASLPVKRYKPLCFHWNYWKTGFETLEDPGILGERPFLRVNCEP